MIATIYKCGNFPTFSGMAPGNWNATNATAHFGGLPQTMDLEKHLAQVQLDVEGLLPDPQSEGVASIDWEAWKPNSGLQNSGPESSPPRALAEKNELGLVSTEMGH